MLNKKDKKLIFTGKKVSATQVKQAVYKFRLRSRGSRSFRHSWGVSSDVIS